MSETINAGMNSTESDNNQDSINDMIMEFVDLKKQINKGREELDRLKSDSAIVSISIWMRKIKYKELQKKEAYLRNAILNTSKIIESKEEELKNLRNERRIYFSKLRDQFQTKNVIYMDKFVGAQKEYTNQNLTNDIQVYKEKYKIIYKEVTVHTGQLKNLETLCRLSDVSSDDAIKAINTVLCSISENNNSKLLDINVAQDFLKELESEIERKMLVLNSIRNK